MRPPEQGMGYNYATKTGNKNEKGIKRQMSHTKRLNAPIYKLEFLLV